MTSGKRHSASMSRRFMHCGGGRVLKVRRILRTAASPEMQRKQRRSPARHRHQQQLGTDDRIVQVHFADRRDTVQA